MTVLAGVTVQWGLSPRIIVIPVAETDVSLTDLQDTLQDLEDDSQGMPFPKLRSMTGGQELDASTNVGFTMQLQNAQLIWQTNNTVLDSGTVTTPDTNGLILIDSTALFITNGVQPGDMLLNITDNSQATILSVVSETQLQIDGLIGGTDNQFDNVDTYSVFDWQLRRLIGGNLVAVNDSGISISPVINSFGNSFDRTSSSSATIQELQDIQYASFGNGVTIDQSGGAAGQIYPFGTRQSPVNNLTDAKAIAVLRGFDKFFIKGTFTFDAADAVDGYEFEGESITRTTITLTAAATIQNCKFSQSTISGSFDGGNDVSSCRVGNLDYIDGVIYDSELDVGTITLGGTQADLIRCYSGVAGGGAAQTPVIDLGGTGTSLVVRDYQGGLKLTNYTSGTDAVSIDLSSGRITFDSTISAGTFTIRGVGFVEDNSTGTAIIKSQILDANSINHSLYDGSVHVNTVSGVPGTEFPIGTTARPVDNIADALAIADQEGFHAFSIHGPITVPAVGDFSGKLFRGVPNAVPVTISAGAQVDDCSYEVVQLSGQLSGVSLLRDVLIVNITDFNGIAENCVIAGGATCSGAGDTLFINCYSSVDVASVPTIDFGGASGPDVVFRGYYGDIKFSNLNRTAAKISMDLASGDVILDSTILDGTVVVRGQGTIINNSTGGTVEDDLLQTVDVQYASFENNSVWIDTAAANTGVKYPVGTVRAPVNNGVDAQLIADDRGLYNLTFRGNTTVTSAHTSMKLWGRSPRTTQITIDPTATLSGCEFELCLLSGDLGSNGSSYFITVALKDVTGIFGHLEGCILREGTNTLSTPNGFAMLNKCSAVSAVNPGTDIPIFDLNGSGRVAARSLDGEIIFQNKSSGNDCSLHLDGGKVTLDSTITQGTWRFLGVGVVIDNSIGATVDISELTSPQSVAETVGTRVIESTYTADEVLKIMASALAGKVSGAGSGIETFKGLDGATNRIVSTVDVNGNRTAVAADGS